MDHNNYNDIKYAELYSKWYSWGSPIGLGIFFISLAVTFVIVLYGLKLYF